MNKKGQTKSCFDKLFLQVVDSRDSSKVTYPLNEILFQSIAAICSGAEGPSDIADFGEECSDWLKEYYPYKNGVPSHDTINTVLARLPIKEFEEIFINWVYEVFKPPTHMGHIAIDGKRIARSVRKRDQQRSKEDGGSHAKVLVNALNVNLNLVLGQADSSDTMSEVSGAEFLLDLLQLKGCCITADAGFLGRDLIKTIRDKQADYLMTLKAKSPRFYEAVDQAFAKADKEESITEENRMEETESGHGRKTKRVYESLEVSELENKSMVSFYQDATTLVRVKRWRSTADKKADEPSVHYYVTSLATGVESLAKLIRGHWAIENKLHWTLDVMFKEDDIRSWRENLAVNMALLRKISLNLISQSSRGKGMKRRRFRAMISGKSRHELLQSIMR